MNKYVSTLTKEVMQYKNSKYWSCNNCYNDDYKTHDLHYIGHLAYNKQKPKTAYNCTADVYQVTALS